MRRRKSGTTPPGKVRCTECSFLAGKDDLAGMIKHMEEVHPEILKVRIQQGQSPSLVWKDGIKGPKRHRDRG